MDATARKAADFASDLQYADLTPAAIHAIKRCMVDSIGCVYGTFNDPPLPALRKLAGRVNGEQPATIIGTDIPTSPELAAFTNGAMIRYGDFSDDYFGLSGDSGPHPSDNIAAVLAAVESVGADGKSLVLGIAIAYEIVGQIADQCTMSARGWDYSVYHSLATALGTGKVLGLTREQMREVVALAIVPNIGLRQTRVGHLSNWKGFAGPNASRNGLFAAQLAKEGVTGPAEPFEGRAGFKKQLDQPFTWGAFAGNDTRFKVEQTSFKYHPSAYSAQLPVWVALEVRTQVKIEEIEAIRVYLIRRYAYSRDENPASWDPQTRETADHSLPYQIGAALVDGAITAKTFTPERFRDPVILDLTAKIRLEPDDAYTAAFPRTSNCRFEVTLKSGEVVTVHQANPKGHPANPMTDEDIEEKFFRQTDLLLPGKQARALLDQLWRLEQLGDMKPLLGLMKLPV